MTINDFDVTKNVEEEFSISVQGFTEIAPPAGTEYLFARIVGTIVIAATWATKTSPSATLALTSPAIEATPTGTATGPTSVTISTTATDCHILQGLTATFSSTTEYLGAGTYAV